MQRKLPCLWVFSCDVSQKLAYNVSFSLANGGDVLTEALHLHFSMGKYSSVCRWEVKRKPLVFVRVKKDGAC